LVDPFSRADAVLDPAFREAGLSLLQTVDGLGGDAAPKSCAVAVVTAPPVHLLGLVLPLMAQGPVWLSCCWVPRSWLGLVPAPVREWLAALHAGGQMRLLEGGAASYGAWLLLGSHPGVLAHVCRRQHKCSALHHLAPLAV
jgi:hypothetical protein